MKVDNAIILAAGTSSRFAPLSYEKHKAMTVVKGEILIERQIQQLKAVGIPEIVVVTGYKAEQFEYLVSKYGIKLIHNQEYLTRNNNSSIWAAKEVLGNSYICSSDNYFAVNPFETEVYDAYYAAEYTSEYTDEWCMTEDENGYINSVTIGGSNAWYMLGHTFWSSEFSDQFLSILEKEYHEPETRDKLWEKIFMAHLDVLKMRMKKYASGIIYEFDTMDELRKFDSSYVTDTHSVILKKIAKDIGTTEDRIVHISALKGNGAEAIGFEFDDGQEHFRYLYKTEVLEKLD
ncbi:MAG TPA: NTP transferase domain-containing protein [Candidatus Merdisoma merdipullorum]|nr:NTP transferase domain-containing protein [Candidatus Merdisoma merdipullorum]